MIPVHTNITVTSKKKNLKTNTMTLVAESFIILTVFITFIGYLWCKLAYEDGY